MEDNLISAVVETITPEMAARYLSRNKGNNRSLSKDTVNFYASLMKRGQWLLNGEAICFDEDGALVNGQHRLQAVIKAGMPVRFLVVRGCDVESFKTYDSGKNRRSADVFKIVGVPYAANVASIVSRFMLIKRAQKFISVFGERHQGFTGVRRAANLSKADILEEYKSTPDLYQDAAALAFKLVDHVKLFYVAEVGALYVFLIKEKGHEEQKVRDFFTMLFYGENVTNQTINTLRAKIIKDKMNNKSTSMTALYKQAILAKTWNAYLKGVEYKTLSWSSEKEGNIRFL